jgi:hypothetical protein
MKKAHMVGMMANFTLLPSIQGITITLSDPEWRMDNV